MTNNLARGVDVSESTSKACTKCKKVKPLDDFYVKKTASDGRVSWCAECTRARRRAYGKANRAKETAQSAQWRAENKARHDEYMKKWRAENRDAIREHDKKWRDSNRELKRALDRAFRAKNAEAIRQKRADNIEFHKERERRYRASSNAHAQRERKRRAAKMGSEVGPIDLDALWTGMCGICGGEMDRDLPWPDPMSKSIDHILPLSLGGGHTQENLQYAHLFCNVSKGNRPQS